VYERESMCGSMCVCVCERGREREEGKGGLYMESLQREGKMVRTEEMDR